MTKVVSLDFELGSLLNLREVGSDVWTKHPSTIPILCGFALDHGAPECFEFDKRTSPPKSFTDAVGSGVEKGAEIHAWNAPFEWAVWNNICVPRFHWPALPIERFHCTMAAAACAGLPMSLSDAALALGSPYVKDMAGHRNMLRMARPRAIDLDGTVHWWHREEPAKLQALIDYNLGDVNAEREIHLRIPRMTKREREIWLVDQKMNARGLPVDQELLTALHAITLQELLRLNAEIARLTNGVVTGSAQNMKLLAWATAKGYPHLTLERETLDAFVQTPEFKGLASYVQEVLALRAEAAKTSTAKLHTIAQYSQIDGVVRNLVQYGGAVRTLRWAGRGPQIQNFPKPIINDVDSAIAEIKLGMGVSGLRYLFGKPLDVVSSCLRGVFAAPEGFAFAVADYHAIEAIVIAWLAEFDDMLDVFRKGEDIYVFTAKGVGSTNRMLGKVLRLACGYGMGHVKFLETAAGYGVKLNPLQAKDAVVAFRQANAPIVSLWHACENCAKNAILSPSDTYQFKKLKFRMANPKGRLAGALLMELPSGRNLVYRNARLESGRIVFWGVNQFTRKWCEQDTYGGKLVENATQAVARDLLADAIVSSETTLTINLLTTVHDEIVAMAPEERAEDILRTMKFAMNHPPAWGKGLPLSCSGAVVKRYGKL